MESAKTRMEVYYRIEDSRGLMLSRKLQHLGFDIRAIIISDNYLLYDDFSLPECERIARMLIQPVTQDYVCNTPYVPEGFAYAIEIGFLPGVTDNVSHTVRESIEDLFKRPLDTEKSVFCTTTYFLKGDIGRETAVAIAMELHNPLIQRMKVLSAEEYRAQGGMGREVPVVHLHERIDVDEVNINVSEEELLKIGKEGIADSDGSRRGPLALDMLSLNTIRDYFNTKEKRNPTDVELESIAQTWSEHCKHTIFAAKLDEVEGGIFRTYIREATERIRKTKGERDFCFSVFSDNSGGIIFDEEYVVSDKVETHNSPSALDPFGGSITGIVGVNRDTIGFGLAARPIANRYGFCFADPFDNRPLYRTQEKDSRLLPPRRIMEGVVHGVNVGGNCSGIPTPQGFVYFDDRYKGKPLVFVGTIGLIPRKVLGKASYEKKAIPGDYIVMIGGRVGRDGIHGATFSSEALSSGSPATAVQIGDPITQKKLSDAIVKEARDKGLYHSITDNGAGGLSCSVAEMARESGGFEVDLEKVPLKYPGMAPWQIWVSESQERMTLSVPEDRLRECLELMKRRGVEATVIGRFTDSARGLVRFNGKKVFDLDLEFLHEGLPRKELHSAPRIKNNPYPPFVVPGDMNDVLHRMVGRLNTASYEFISTQYDHEVQANSVIKPLQGPGRVNGNATVIRPLPHSYRGVVLSQALYPSYSDIDTYRMAACSIDTAIRNAISVGGSLDNLALLDNFCWCDSGNPERLGELKDAAKACFYYAVVYGTPFISGKDSMFNDFHGYDENFNEVRISIPPTLLISSIGVVEDVRSCQTIDFKCTGDLVYCVGTTGTEMGGTEYLAMMGERLSGSKYIGNKAPSVNAEDNIKLYGAVEAAMKKGYIASSISVERGGLGVALAKSAMAGMTGCSVDLSKVPAGDALRDDDLLFSESQGRFLFSVNPMHKDDFERLFNGLPLACIGAVSDTGTVEVRGTGGSTIVAAGIDTLRASYKSTFTDFQG